MDSREPLTTPGGLALLPTGAYSTVYEATVGPLSVRLWSDQIVEDGCRASIGTPDVFSGTKAEAIAWIDAQVAALRLALCPPSAGDEARTRRPRWPRR